MININGPTFFDTSKTENESLEDEIHKDVNSPRFQSPWVRAAQLPELFCSWDLAYRCTRSGWLLPIIQGKRRTIYRLADIQACLQRIEAGEFPPARSTKAAP